VKPNAYAPYGIEVARALKEHLSKEELREIHRLRPARHFLVVAWQVFFTGLVAIGLWHFTQPWIWIPLALLQGFNILGFIILLHEQVHLNIFTRPRPRLMRLLGLAYAFPSSISATQFKIWHLDHHNELGSSESDPKRAYLTPKIVRRWYKLLYMTPALFVIYSRAALKEAATYSPELRRLINLERAIYMTLHVAILVSLWVFFGAGVALRVHFVPLFLAFPIAFTLNRLGQHYDIEPSDPLRWSTLINPSPTWNLLFLWSNLHLEHHYFPRVPFYKLKALNRRLQGFYREHGVEPRTYRRILWEWFVKNQVPHTNWFEESVSSSRGASAAAATSR